MTAVVSPAACWLCATVGLGGCIAFCMAARHAAGQRRRAPAGGA